MAGGVKISYISGTGEQEQAQQLLDGIVATDQLSYYSLNISKAQLLSLINDYDTGSTLSGWNVSIRSQAGKIVNEIDDQLSILGERQNEIISDPDVQVNTGYDPQFADFIGINGLYGRQANLCPPMCDANGFVISGSSLQKRGTNLCPPVCDAYITNTGSAIGVIPVVVIVAAIIVGGAVLYELVQWLEVLTVESEAQVEQSEILKKAAMDLTPAEQKAYWNDIQRQLDNAYQAGFASGNDGSLFGDATQFLTVAVIGLAIFNLPKLINGVSSRRQAPKQISGVKKTKKHWSEVINADKNKKAEIVIISDRSRKHKYDYYVTKMKKDQYGSWVIVGHNIKPINTKKDAIKYAQDYTKGKISGSKK